jgi:hypothetical protein
VLSLVFVGLQMNQDRELKTIELIWSSIDRMREQHLYMLGENPQRTAAKAAIKPEELTAEDLLIMHNWFRADLFRITQISIMVDQGIFPKSVLEGFTETGLLETPIGQKWLASGALDTHGLPQDHVAGIRKRRNNPNGTQEWIQAAGYLANDTLPTN